MVSVVLVLALAFPVPLTGAELTPIPPVTLPGPVTPPETAPPEVLPPAISFPGGTPGAPGTFAPSPGALAPMGPGPAVPPSVGGPAPLPPLPLVALPPEMRTDLAAPEGTAEAGASVSQPLGAVSPETVAETEKKIEAEGIYFNVADADIREVVKQISRALGKNFILDDKVRGKITIISERKMTKAEVWEAFQSALDVIGFTIVEGPAGLLRLVQTREAISYPVEVYTDGTPYTDRFITRLINPKNISAADTANVIKTLVSKEGNLIAYPTTNTLIITDSGTNIERLVRLINELDQEGPQEVLEIIPLLYADAKDLAAKLTQIFEVQPKGAATEARPKRGRRGEEAGAEEVEAIQKIIPDDRTNSLIVLASKVAIRKVRELIKQLDAPLAGPAEGEVHVYYLRHASAKDMASVLSALSSAVSQARGKDRKGAEAAPAAKVPEDVESVISGVSLTGKWTVTADEGTNALVITSSPKDFQILIDQVISKLDIPRRQVYVEAVIVELSVSSDQQIGMGAIGGKTLNVGGSQIAAFGSTFGFLDINRLLGGSMGAADTTTTININQPGTAGSTTQLSVPAFFAALQLAQGNTDVNILSTPNLLTLDNQEAEIKVGQKVPFPTAAATTIGGSLQTTFTREDVALTLKIKPQISESDTIRLEVTQEDREVLPQQEQPLIAAQAGPSTTERSIKTTIVANNGQTIVLGGLIKDKFTTVVNKIPILGDIPLLGYLFKVRRKSKQKVNLVVFLTPNIIREPRDFLAIVQRKVREKNTFISENFNRAQQKLIRQSIETHAGYLMEFAKEMPIEERPGYAPREELPSPAPRSGEEPQEVPPEPESGGLEEAAPEPEGEAAGVEGAEDLSVGEPRGMKGKGAVEREKRRSKKVNPVEPGGAK